MLLSVLCGYVVFFERKELEGRFKHLTLLLILSEFLDVLWVLFYTGVILGIADENIFIDRSIGRISPLMEETKCGSED